MICTYKIINTVTEKYYIGSTKNNIIRWKKHKNLLKKNKHHCSRLQRSWNKHGKECFIFEVDKEFETIKEALIEEQRIIDELFPQLYNTSKHVAGILFSQYSIEDLNDRLSKMGKERNANMTPEERKKAYGRPGSSHVLYGTNRSEETKKKISESLKGKKHTMETRKKMSDSKIGEKHHRYGKHLSEETRKKLSDAKKGHIAPNRVPVIINNIEYVSLTEAAKHLNISANTVKSRVNNLKFPNYQYKENK